MSESPEGLSPQFEQLASQVKQLQREISDLLEPNTDGTYDCIDWTDKAMGQLTDLKPDDRTFDQAFHCRSETTDFTHSWLELKLDDAKNSRTFIWDGSLQFLPKTLIDSREVGKFDPRFLREQQDNVTRTDIFALDDQ